MKKLGWMGWLTIIGLASFVIGRIGTWKAQEFNLSLWALVLPGLLLMGFYGGALVIWLRLHSGAVVADLPAIRDSIGTSPKLYTAPESTDGRPGQTVLNTGGASIPNVSSWFSKNAFAARSDSVEHFGKHILAYGVFKSIPGKELSGVTPEGMDVLINGQLSGFLPKRGKVWFSLLNTLVEGESDSELTKQQSDIVDLNSHSLSRLWSLIKSGDKLLLEAVLNAMKQAQKRQGVGSRILGQLPPMESEKTEMQAMEEMRKQ